MCAMYLCVYVPVHGFIFVFMLISSCLCCCRRSLLLQSICPDDLLYITLNVVIFSYIIRVLMLCNVQRQVVGRHQQKQSWCKNLLIKSLFHWNTPVGYGLFISISLFVHLCASENHMHQHFGPKFTCQTIMNHRFVRLLDAHLALSVREHINFECCFSAVFQNPQPKAPSLNIYFVVTLNGF